MPLIYLYVTVPTACSFYHACSVVQLVVKDGDSPRSSFIVKNSFCPPLAAPKSHLCIVPCSLQPPSLPTASSSVDSRSSLARVLELDFNSLTRGIGPPACPTMSDAAVDTSSEITTKDLKEKEVVEKAENRRDAPANGNAQNEENGEQEAGNEVAEEQEEGVEEEEEEEDGDGEEEDGDDDEEDDDVDSKQGKAEEDD